MMSVRYTHAVLCRIPLSLRTRGEVQLEEARKQHQALAQLLRELGVDVVEMPPDESSPLCVFVEDLAVVCNGIALIARPNESSRLKEVSLCENNSINNFFGFAYHIDRVISPCMLCVPVVKCGTLFTTIPIFQLTYEVDLLKHLVSLKTSLSVRLQFEINFSLHIIISFVTLKRLLMLQIIYRNINCAIVNFEKLNYQAKKF